MKRPTLPDPSYQDNANYQAGIRAAADGLPRVPPRGAGVWWERGWDVQSGERLLDEVLRVERRN